jgi:hypothetical protein
MLNPPSVSALNSSLAPSLAPPIKALPESVKPKTRAPLEYPYRPNELPPKFEGPLTYPNKTPEKVLSLFFFPAPITAEKIFSSLLTYPP